MSSGAGCMERIGGLRNEGEGYREGETNNSSCLWITTGAGTSGGVVAQREA